MSIKQTLLDRIEKREAHVGIVGLGYVGLPLAVEFAQAGFKVTGLDVNASKVAELNKGVSYIGDIPSEHIQEITDNGKFHATTDYDDLKDVDTISICVPTPLRQTKDPDMSFIIESLESIVKISHQGMLIVLESTTYPGTTEELVMPQLVENGFTVGEDIFIAFSPERIDPGNKEYGVKNTPKVVGGITPNCIDAVEALYATIVNQVVTVSSTTAAEMVKLLENTFRAVNIGLVNEMALMCDKLGVDVWEVIEAAASKPFGFMPFYPGPGLGGHCIPVDPHYLSWKLKTLNYNARFIELASEINTSMPLYVLDKVTDALNEESKSVRGSRVVVLGVAYKPDVDDVRESPALDVISLLRKKGADVVFHDPYVESIKLEDDSIMSGQSYSNELFSEADCVVIITHHSSYNWPEILQQASLVVDTRHVTVDFDAAARVVTL